jgi:hypothetical protein
MFVSNLPTPRNLADIAPGSLSFVPGENVWGVRMTTDNLYMLEIQRPQRWNGRLADFGQNFEVFVDTDTASRLTYPWVIAEHSIDALALFVDDDVVSRSVVLGNGADGTLITIDLNSGRQTNRTSDSGEAIAYSEWGINLRCSDKPGDMQNVFTFGGD